MAHIHDLERQRNELKNQLDEYKDLRGHRTYKQVERQLHSVREKIKIHYKDAQRDSNAGKV